MKKYSPLTAAHLYTILPKNCTKHASKASKGNSFNSALKFFLMFSTSRDCFSVEGSFLFGCGGGGGKKKKASLGGK